MNKIPLFNKDGQKSLESIENIALPSIDEVSVKEEDDVEREEEKEGKGLFVNEISDSDIIECYKKAKEKDLEVRTSKKFLSSHSKNPYHKSRFTSTWVQYESEGGTDYDPGTQNPFYRIVFIILLAMLIVTAGFNYLCTEKTKKGISKPLRRFFVSNSSLILVIPAAVIMISLNFTLMAAESTKSPPFIYIFLVITVVATCIVTGFFSARANNYVIVLIYIPWGAVVIALILLTFVNFDFTHWFLHIIGLSVAGPFLISFGAYIYDRFIEFPGHEEPIKYSTLMIYLTVIAANILLMTIMLRILLGGRVVELGESDYALAAFYLYTAPYDVFLKILQVLPRLCSCVKGESDTDD